MESKLSKRFEDYLKQRIPNKKTMQNYCKTGSLFVERYYGNYTLSALQNVKDKDLVGNCSKFIVEKPRAWNRKFALRKLLDFIGKPHLYELLPKFHQLPRVQIKKDILFSDVKRIVEALPEPYSTVFVLQYSTASRVDEILRLTSEDIGFEAQTSMYILNMRTKGSYIRVAYLDQRASEILKEYLKKRKNKQGRLFDVKYDNALYHIKKGSKDILGSRITTHWLRHSRIMELVRTGYSLDSIQRFTGHKNLSSLQKYLAESGMQTKQLQIQAAPKW